jgi:outer membrane receptor for ferrienterochelin and colicins
MKLFLSISILLFSVSISWGQRTIVVTGSDNTPLATSYATVQTLDGASSTLYANDGGEIQVTVSGDLIIYVQCYGYHSFKDTLKSDQTTLNVKLKKLTHYEDPTTITGNNRKVKQVNAVHKVKVIDSKTIEQTGSVDLKDALRNQLNVQLGQDNVLGSNLTLQGISGEGVKILIDGIPMVGRLNGNIDLSQINMNNVERIEIIEGPMSVLYGSDALGGVINIITKTPDSKGTLIEIGTYNDNFEHHNVTGSVRSKVSKTVDFSLSGGRNFFRGYDFNDSTRSVDWKPRTQYFSEANVFLKFNKHNHRIRNRFYQDKLSVRSDAEHQIYTITGYNTNFYTNRLDFDLFSTFDLANKAKVQIINSGNFYTRRKEMIRRNLVTGEEVDMPAENFDTTEYNQMLSRGFYYTNRKGKSNYMVGYEVNVNEGVGSRIEGFSQSANEVALFGSAVFKTKKVKINPGIRFMHNSRFGKPLAKSGILSNVKTAPIIPSLHARIALSRKWVLRTSLSKGYRAPGIKELFFYFVDKNHNIVGNSELSPEESLHAGVSIAHRFAVGKNKMFNFSSDLFYNKLKDKIQLVVEDPQNLEYSYRNIGKLNTVGGGLGGRFRTKRYSISLNIAANGLKATTGKFHWNNQVNVGINYNEKLTGTNLVLNTKFNGKSWGFNDDLTMYHLEPFTMTDFTVSKKILDGMWRITAGMKNVFDVINLQSRGTSSSGHSSELGNIPMSLGRTYFASVIFVLDLKPKKQPDDEE